MTFSQLEDQTKYWFCKFLLIVNDDKTNNQKEGLLFTFMEQMKVCKLKESNLAREKNKSKYCFTSFKKKKERKRKHGCQNLKIRETD